MIKGLLEAYCEKEFNEMDILQNFLIIDGLGPNNAILPIYPILAEGLLVLT